METISTELRRRVLQNFARYVIGDAPGFGKRVGDRIQVTELIYCPRILKAMAICEVVVKEDMLNREDNSLHTCCSVYLIDMVSALPFIVIGLAQEEQKLQNRTSQSSKFAMAPFAPSQRLDVTFHYGASLGARLKVISTSLTHSGSLLIVHCEIWDIDEDQLVASAIHCKVMPKKPPLAANSKL